MAQSARSATAAKRYIVAGSVPTPSPAPKRSFFLRVRGSAGREGPDPGMKKLLLVDLDPALSAKLAQLLAGASEAFEVRRCPSAREALDSLAAAPCDIVLADLGLPDTNGG